MLSTSIPTKIQLPWAANAGSSFVRTVPVPSQIGITDGAASFNDGFPPLTFLPDSAGGINPDGRDANGALKALSALLWWYSAGAPITYDVVFQTAIGGYPKGAIIQSAVTTGLMWLSVVENNVTDPDTGGAGWTNMTPISGTAVVTGTGFSGTAPTATAKYQVFYNWCKLSIPQTIIGTSNSTSFTITGLPAICAPATDKQLSAIVAGDGGFGTYGTASFVGGSSVLYLGKEFVAFTGTSWTNSGTKALFTTEFGYSLS